MEFRQIIQDIKKGNFQSVYFLHGQESYFIDQIADAIEANALTEAEKSFNLSILYGKEIEPQSVIDSARRYPMMAQRQVVILREAQEMQNLAALDKYIQQPLESTVLVICYKHKKHRLTGAFGKLVKAKALVFEAKRVYDNKMPAWITQYLESKKYTVDPEAARLVAEYLGTKLSNVTNELDKLCLNLEPGSRIHTAEIEEHIGISREYNVFELQKALGLRDTGKAFRITQYFAGNPKKHPLVMVIGALYNYFSKLYILQGMRAAGKSEQEILRALKLNSAYFIKEYNQAAREYPKAVLERIIQLLAVYDMKSKGVDFNATTSDDAALYQELIWKILHEKVAS